MSDDLPAPLVPADVDISGLDGFMLNVQRLFASELWALSTGDEFKAAMGLWGRAWQQSPPGSLPNDDRVLGAFSGAGSKWKKVRAVALRGFVKCSDGRIYHSVLCDDVMNAWTKRVGFRERTAAATEAKRLAKQEREEREAFLKRGQQRERDEDRNDAGDEQRNDQQNGQSQQTVTTPVTGVQGQGQGQGHKEKKESLAPAPVIEPAKPSAPAEAVAGAVFDPIEEGRAIGRAFGDAMDAVYGSMAMRSQNATDEFHCAKQLAADLGLTGAEAAAIFDAEMRANAEKGREPIRSIRYLDKRIREAYAKNAEAAAQREASGSPPAPPAVDRPYEDHATMQWRSRLEGFRDYGAWSQNHGPKPPGAGQPMPPRAEYPEALAIEIGVSGPAADEAGKAA